MDREVGTRPTGPNPANKPKPKPPAKKPSPKPSTKKPGGGGGGSSKDPYRAAENRAVARENKAKAKAGKRALEQAAALDAQAKALRAALKTEYRKSLSQNLRDVGQTLSQQQRMLKEGANDRYAEFRKTAQDTEKAASDTAERGFANLIRERQDSMQAVLDNGAGETDTVRTLLMSLRNWQSNAAENNRAKFDTLRSVNQGITDLAIDTKSALANSFAAAEGERERLWQDYFNRRADSFTQLGNTYGQQREYYATAREMGVKTPKEKGAKKASEKAFMDAAKEAGKSYKQQALPKWIDDYDRKPVTAKASNTNLAAAVKLGPVETPEGAILRKWE